MKPTTRTCKNIVPNVFKFFIPFKQAARIFFFFRVYICDGESSSVHNFSHPTHCTPLHSIYFTHTRYTYIDVYLLRPTHSHSTPGNTSLNIRVRLKIFYLSSRTCSRQAKINKTKKSYIYICTLTKSTFSQRKMKIASYYLRCCIRAAR